VKRAGRAIVLAAAAALVVAGCAASPTAPDADRPGYLAAGPTTALDEAEPGGGKATSLALLDQRNRELSAAREEIVRLAAETARLETERARLDAELTVLRARCETAEKGLAEVQSETKDLKEALLRSRLLNVRLSQHLARLDLLGAEDAETPAEPAPAPPTATDGEDR
jgi:hypothetical protein